jgi:uncharacterized RDD family membrane protein YckC
MSQAGSSRRPLPHIVDALPWEARPFQGKRAGIVTRTVANVVDFAVVVGALAGVYVGWCAVTFMIRPARFSFPAPSYLALLLSFGVALLAYLTVSWATTGRTYGDHLLGLRVVSSRAERLRWPVALVRAGFCIVFPIGLFWAAFSSTNRSLQDTVLRTSVIYDWVTRRRTPPGGPQSVASPAASTVLSATRRPPPRSSAGPPGSAGTSRGSVPGSTGPTGPAAPGSAPPTR